MTIVICKKHGNYAGINICEHISTDSPIIENIVKNARKVVFTMGGIPEKESYLCESCSQRIEIENNEKLEFGEPKSEKAYCQANSIACVYCLYELRENE